MIPTIKWHDSEVWMIDQRKLPNKVQWYVCKRGGEVIAAIRKMVIRGAPAIGIAAGMGLALGANRIRARSYEAFRRQFLILGEKMAAARPTAVNLQWAVERMKNLVESMAECSVDEIKEALRTESEKILEEDIECNKKMGQYGQKLVPKGATVLTHCNAGALATGGYGTALGVIRAAHEKGKDIKVIADETRPWLQGLRLTSFELMQDGIPVSVIEKRAHRSGYHRCRPHSCQRRRGKQNRYLPGGRPCQGQRYSFLRGCPYVNSGYSPQKRGYDTG